MRFRIGNQTIFHSVFLLLSIPGKHMVPALGSGGPRGWVFQNLRPRVREKYGTASSDWRPAHLSTGPGTGGVICGAQATCKWRAPCSKRLKNFGAPGWLSRLSLGVLVSAQVMISQFVSLRPALCSMLTAQSLEPALDSVSPSLCPFPACTLSLSLKNK